MLEASTVYFQCVNEQAAHVKIDPLPNNSKFSLTWERKLLETLQEKEKMLVTSIFYFFRDVFHLNEYKFHFLTLYHTMPTFNDPV